MGVLQGTGYRCSSRLGQHVQSLDMIKLSTSLKEHMSSEGWSIAYLRNEFGGGRDWIMAKKFVMSGGLVFL